MADGNGSGLVDRFLALSARLTSRFQERQAVIEGMVCAALAGEHVLLLGPPGTAKSALTREFCSAVGEAQYFEWLLSKFSSPEELYGPISISGLKADRFERVTTGKLPHAHVAFLDEIFKSNSGVLNTLLTALNERKFHNGPAALDIPLRMAVGASNELPEGAELGALYDRFLVRYWVERVRTPEAFFAVLTGSEEALGPLLSLTEWDAARAAVRAVDFPRTAQQSLWNVRAELGKAGIHPSDRRLKRSVNLLRANAWLSGDIEVGDDHFGVLADVLWDAPEQRETVAKVVGKVSAGAIGEASGKRDLMLETIQALPAMPVSGPDKSYQDALVACNRDGNRALKEIRKLAEESRNPRKKEKILAMAKQLDGALGPVRESARQVLGL
jgi:MoxR-like ATPase